MLEADLTVLCERLDINEDEAYDALRTVQLLCASPPHGIELSREKIANVIWAAASLYVALPKSVGADVGFYRFVEDLAAALKRTGPNRRRPVFSPSQV